MKNRKSNLKTHVRVFCVCMTNDFSYKIIFFIFRTAEFQRENLRNNRKSSINTLDRIDHDYHSIFILYLRNITKLYIRRWEFILFLECQKLILSLSTFSPWQHRKNFEILPRLLWKSHFTVAMLLQVQFLPTNLVSHMTNADIFWHFKTY